MPPQLSQKPNRRDNGNSADGSSPARTAEAISKPGRSSSNPASPNARRNRATGNVALSSARRFRGGVALNSSVPSTMSNRDRDSSNVLNATLCASARNNAPNIREGKVSGHSSANSSRLAAGGRIHAN